MIIVVTGTDIEKLKGEFESVINGMNMVGEIPYDIYSELFDVGVDCIQKAYELGKAELKSEKGCETCTKFDEVRLIKAKELLKRFIKLDVVEGFDIVEEAEQFLSEVKK